MARVEGPVTGNLGQPSAALAAAEGFTYLVDLTMVTVAIPYLFSACDIPAIRSRHIQVVLGEAALRTLVCTPEMHAGRLGKLPSP